MRKYIFILAVLLFAAQANAQRMVKYITFYPVPYGSHESLSVEAEFMVNMGNEMTSEVGGGVYIGRDSDFEGFLDILAGLGANTVSGGTIKSGSGNSGSYGYAYWNGNSTYSSITLTERIDNNPPNTLPYAYASDLSTWTTSNILYNTTMSNLPFCRATPSWKALRLKGSEECKYYLTCGGSGNSGCENPPAINCPPNYCLNEANVCESKPATATYCRGFIPNASSGVLQRAVTCTPGSGWSQGAWTGTCTCAAGYIWNQANLSCDYVGNPCPITSCPAGEHLINAGKENCCCELNTCNSAVAGGQLGKCKCPSSSVVIPPGGFETNI